MLIKITDRSANGADHMQTEWHMIVAKDGASPAGLNLGLNAAGTGFTAPITDMPAKSDVPGVYSYGDSNGDGVNNTAGLTVTFTKASGLFKGAFKVWYDYESAIDYTTGKVKSAHTSKKVTFQGALTPVRENSSDGVEGRGFYLWPDKCFYYDDAGKTKTYNFNGSYDFLLLGN